MEKPIVVDEVEEKIEELEDIKPKPKVELKPQRDDNLELKLEKLKPLNREHVTIFKVEGYQSQFIELFLEQDNSIDNREFKLNISTIDYIEDGGDIPIFKQQPSRDMRYAILIFNRIKCCIYPPILKLILQEYNESRVFLIIESEMEMRLKRE